MVELLEGSFFFFFFFFFFLSFFFFLTRINSHISQKEGDISVCSFLSVLFCFGLPVEGKGDLCSLLVSVWKTG